MSDTSASYALYLHPAGGEAVLLDNSLDRLYWRNKGFVRLGRVPAPGAVVGPRDIDRDDSGVPKGPDGSTHDRHVDELTPDGQPVPWGFPVMGVEVPDLTPRTEAYARTVREDGLDEATAQRIREILRERDYDDDDQKRVLGMLRGGELAKPEDEQRRMHQQATLPGVVSEKGLTRGLAGVDLTMPSPVPGIAADDRQGIAGAIDRGEIELRELEVAPGEVVMQQVATHPQTPGPQDAPGVRPGAGPTAPSSPDPTLPEQERQQRARESGSSGGSGSGSRRSSGRTPRARR